MLRFLFFFPLFIFSATSSSTEGLNSASDFLKIKAEVEGFGYKTANLMLLRELLKSEELRESIKPFTVQVPDFMALSSDEIQNLLFRINLDLPQRWKQATKLIEASSDFYIENRTLPQHFIDASKLIARDIEAAFIQLSDSQASISAEFSDFLKKSADHRWRMMVRSTGKEDTDKLANAGGNLSVANLPADSRFLIRAMGQVVASYFEERSLMQRVGARDKTIFDIPLTPILVQRMIGEKLGGENDPEQIPVGCVLYTQETSGRMSDVHRYECSFGHNEGVVQSLVPLDTFYVSKSFDIHSIIKDKSERMVPVFENSIFGLERKANPKILRSRPSLSKEALRATMKVAEDIDAYYAKAMDVEMVFEPGKRTISIVQARPIVIPDPGEEGPSYIAQISMFPRESQISAETVNPVDSSVLRINHPNEIIVESTLDLALRKYTDPNCKRSEVKAILVSRQVDATSHSAAVFRGDSKAILQVEGLEKIRKWFSGRPVIVLIDTQRGILLNLAKHELSSKTLQELFSNRVLKRGWFNYPIPMRVSVDAQGSEYCVPFKKNSLTDFWETQECLKFEAADKIQNLTEKMRIQANCDPQNSQDCLSDRILAFDSLDKLERLNTYAHELAGEIERVSHKDNQMRLLFVKRFLEALVYQGRDPQIPGSFSLKSVKEDYKQGKDFIYSTIKPLIQSKKVSDAVLRNPELFSLARLGARSSLTDEVTNEWIMMNEMIFKGDASNIARWTKMIQELESLGIFDLWINSIFAQAKLGTAKESVYRVFYSEFDNSRHFLDQALEIKNKLEAYKISVWSNPADFDRNRKDFENTFTKYFLSEPFMRTTTQLERLAALSLREEFVTLFDLSIKELKGHPYKDIAQKIEHFKLRLQDYFHVLDRWARDMPQDLIPGSKWVKDWTLDSYLSQVNEALSNTNWKIDDSQFLPSEWDGAVSRSLGRGGIFASTERKSLEDIFIIIHQSLVTVVGALMKDSLGNQLKISEELNHVLLALSTFEVGGNHPSASIFTGLTLTKEGVMFKFNIPLYAHSAVIKLYFDKSTKAMNLVIELIGYAESRWEIFENYADSWARQRDLRIENNLERFLLSVSIANIENVTLKEITDLIDVACFVANHRKLPRHTRSIVD